MRVLLTGASGFLGQHVLNQLSQQGINVVAVGRSHPANYSGNFIKADLLQIDCLADIVQRAGASHLLHLAWYAEHGKYWTSPLNLRWLEASIRLVEAFCSAGGQKVVVAGTCAEYDWSCGYCREGATPLVPATMYGVAKDATRRLLSVICNSYHVPMAWGRVFLPYGQGEDQRRLITSLIKVFEGKLAPFGVNAKAYKDFIHVEDVAGAFLSLLETNAVGTFNICSAQPIQISEVVRIIAKSRNADPEIILNLTTERLDDPAFLVGDNLALKALGWQAKYVAMNDGLAYYDQWSNR